MRGQPADDASAPPAWACVAQTLAGLGLMVGGAKVFVTGLEAVAKTFGVSSLVLALLVAPVATELPETFNSVLWIRRRKDTLALGNITGAMVFQSSFPVSVGLLFTPWHLSRAGLASAVIALVAAATVYATLRVRGTIAAWLLLLQAVFYAGYVAYILTGGS
jgi:cation:H+ antiporter